MPSTARTHRLFCFSHQIPSLSQHPNTHVALLTPKPRTSPLESHPLFAKTHHRVSPETKEKILFLELIGVDAGKALALNPTLHSSSTTLLSIGSTISFLRSKGLLDSDLPRIFKLCPRVLSADPDLDLAPVFDFLRNELRVPERDLRRVVNKCPRLLVSSVVDQLKPALFYLRRLGFGDSRGLAYRDPILLVTSVEEKLVPRVRFLEGLGLTTEDLVARWPALLTYSLENNLVPKSEYFREEMEGEVEEIKGFPQFFGFSLENMIKPRHLEMVGCGVKLPLELMLKGSDDEFRELLKKQSDSGGL